MRKNQLIKKLQEIEGNPEVLFYNGWVGDWQHISILEWKLVSYSKKFIKEVKEAILKLKEKDHHSVDHILIKKNKPTKQNWQIENPFIEEKDKSYKKVILIEANPRNKTSWGRGGSLGY